MNCPFCNHENAVIQDAEISILDGDCPSSCDDQIAIVAYVECPTCGRKMWAKTINADYATRRQWPPFVKFGKVSQKPVEEDLFCWTETPETDVVHVCRRLPDGEEQELFSVNA